MSYPLYDELVAEVRNKKEKPVEIQRICTTINSLAQVMTREEACEHYEEILALIFHYETQNSPILLSSNPYGSKTMVGGKGIRFTCNKLPPQLQQIIARYVERCSK